MTFIETPFAKNGGSVVFSLPAYNLVEADIRTNEKESFSRGYALVRKEDGIVQGTACSYANMLAASVQQQQMLEQAYLSAKQLGKPAAEVADDEEDMDGLLGDVPPALLN